MAMSWNMTNTTLAKSPVTHHGSLKPVLTKFVRNPWRLAIGSTHLSGNWRFLLMSPADAATPVTSFSLHLRDISRVTSTRLAGSQGQALSLMIQFLRIRCGAAASLDEHANGDAYGAPSFERNNVYVPK